MDATNTKIETSSPSNVKDFPSNAADPLKIKCPICNAAIGAKCMEPKKDGAEFVNWFHIARVEGAINPVPESTTESGAKPGEQQAETKRKKSETVY